MKRPYYRPNAQVVELKQKALLQASAPTQQGDGQLEISGYAEDEACGFHQQTN